MSRVVRIENRIGPPHRITGIDGKIRRIEKEDSPVRTLTDSDQVSCAAHDRNGGEAQKKEPSHTSTLQRRHDGTGLNCVRVIGFTVADHRSHFNSQIQKPALAATVRSHSPDIKSPALAGLIHQFAPFACDKAPYG